MTRLLIFLIPLTLLVGCGKSDPPPGNAEETSGKPAIPFESYSIVDSSQIVQYEDNLQLYTVLEGPGPLPEAGMTLRIHYQGKLLNGKVFDSSYKRGEPLKVRLGNGSLIKGFDYAVQQLRLGSKAVAIVPPKLAYGDRLDVPDVPPNSTLVFDIDVMGTF